MQTTDSKDDARLEYEAAAAAVHAERRAASKSVLLRCHDLKQQQDEHGRVFELRVTRFARLDWTWEGARAFADLGSEDATVFTPNWAGEVVEVDTVANRLFVAIDAGAPAPTIGEFVVQPFDYLESLDELFNGELASTFAPSLTQELATASGQRRPGRLPNARVQTVADGVWTYDRGAVWGPPGTGKTHSLGEHTAAALQNTAERILIVSTTNKATDGAALAVIAALRRNGQEPDADLLRRVGAGVDPRRFRAVNAAHLIDEGPAETRKRLAELIAAHRRSRSASDRARLWVEIRDSKKELALHATRLEAVESRVIVATSYLALRGLTSGRASAGGTSATHSFTTVLVDEAGLLPRVTIAALALWCRHRLVLYGDPRQLSPISRVSRILEPKRARWIARSALDHLLDGNEPGVRLLTTQHRMHAEIRQVVSDYSYEGRLVDAESLSTRGSGFTDERLAGSPRAIWYVLDEDSGAGALLRAERGPGSRSWVRKRSQEVLERLFRAHPELRHRLGMFVTPFVAQARQVGRWLLDAGAANWSASTTHAQQGSEADIVVFDTVHAGSTAWSNGEWQRLINVGMSRARELLIVIASRLEMRAPFLQPLARALAPRVLRGVGGHLQWQTVDITAQPHAPSRQRRELDPASLGAQIESRRTLRAILGADQERLCALPIDGKPRLVRGVAGSGKTAILANWLARRLAEAPDQGPFWVVYANQALKGLIQSHIAGVWHALGQPGEVPWDQVEVLHVLELLDQLEREAELPPQSDDQPFDFEGRAARLLELELTPRCKTMFIDEAQDCGEQTIALLARLVAPADPAHPEQRAIHVFYDNAQNVYGRGTPRWVALGIDVVGRSTVMKESYRATLPATEFALNVLYRLMPPGEDPDHAELVRRDLVHQEQRNERPWWRVRFNEVDGPLPELLCFPDRRSEIESLTRQVETWIREEGVRPRDIRVITHSRGARRAITAALTQALAPHDVRVEHRTSTYMVDEDHVLLVSTAHSFKGYDAEIVAVAAADAFVARIHGVPTALAHPLYVAMTRARSILRVSAATEDDTGAPRSIVEALESTYRDQQSVPSIRPACTAAEEHHELLEQIGPEHRDWLQNLTAGRDLVMAPPTRADGSVLANPLFRVRMHGRWVACFREPPAAAVVAELRAAGMVCLVPGERPPEARGLFD